jgi:transposase-like protein
MEFMADFPDDAVCLEWLWTTRYAPDGEHAECPKCEQVRAFAKYDAKGRHSWTCTACGHHVSATAGTIFHKSSTSLHLWFYAMYLMTSTRCGISAKQLERELGVTYKTAWRMFTLIRNELMAQDDEPLSGEVEMDETYVGGKPRQSDRAKWDTLPNTTERRQAAQRWSHKKKVPVFGMVERGGKVTAFVAPRQWQASAFAHIDARVLPASVVYTDEVPTHTPTTVYTDEAAAYAPLANRGYDHKRIHHAEKVYVSGDVHTNTIEGFWSLVKRGIGGTHHAVSAKWLQGYLNEYVWRYNRRDDGRAQFLSLLLASAVTPLA